MSLVSNNNSKCWYSALTQRQGLWSWGRSEWDTGAYFSLTFSTLYTSAELFIVCSYYLNVSLLLLLPTWFLYPFPAHEAIGISETQDSLSLKIIILKLFSETQMIFFKEVPLGLLNNLKFYFLSVHGEINMHWLFTHCVFKLIIFNINTVTYFYKWGN